MWKAIRGRIAWAVLWERLQIESLSGAQSKNDSKRPCLNLGDEIHGDALSRLTLRVLLRLRRVQ